MVQHASVLYLRIPTMHTTVVNANTNTIVRYMEDERYMYIYTL